MDWWQYLIVITVLFIICLIVLKINRKDFSIETNKLVEYLGGKDNIIDIESNISRLKVTLKNVELANKEAIQKLGAQGIVEINNQLKIIFGQDARILKKCIKEMKL